MPETYYYATGTEVTSIADAIRNKGGTSQSLVFPDDFVEVIENLEAQPDLKALTINPHYEGSISSSSYTVKHIPGYDLVNIVRLVGRPLPTNNIVSVDLSGFNVGDTCYVKGVINSVNGSGQSSDSQDMEGSFTWAASNTYTKGLYTLTITSSSVQFSKTGGIPYALGAGNSNPFGYKTIGFAKINNTDGYSTITVNPIPSTYKDTSNANITAEDVINGKIAYGSSGQINGSLVIQHYYTGSVEPSSSLGANGDIYLKT